MTPDLADTLEFQLRAVGIEAIREYKFCDTRKFRADICIITDGKRLIVECNGGTWMAKSGHSSSVGIHRDYEKANLAQLLGYVYLQYTRKEIEDGSALSEIEQYLERSENAIHQK